MNNKIDRTGFETAYMNLLSNPKYVKQHFYAFVIAKMQVTVDHSVPTAAAGFYNNNFQLIINPDFINKLPLKQGMGLLVHETLHILLKHLGRKGEKDHRLWNIACDVALNQSLPDGWLPEGGLLPESFKLPNGKYWDKGLTAEQYYELTKDEKERQEQEKQDGESGQDQDQDQDQDEGQGEGQGQGEGEGEGEGESGGEGDPSGNQENSDGGYKPSNGNPNLTTQEEITIDDHSKWSEMSETDEELAKEIMGKVIDEALEKSRGNAPSNIDEMMKLWKKAPKLSWKKILKRYLSSKKGSKVSSIKKRNRRIRQLGIKGNKTARDIPEVITLIDVSGSVSDQEILNGLVEITEICKISNSNMKYIQVDTTPRPTEEFDPKKKDFKRFGCGGTYIAAGIKQVMDEKLPCDVVVVITDGFIEDVSTDTHWNKFKKPVIFLTTTGEMTPVGPRKVVYNIKDA